MRPFFTLLLIIVTCFTVLGQESPPSIHEIQLNEFNSSGNTDAAFYESISVDQVTFEKTNCTLDKVVYGWHPYWGGSAYQNYQWDLLSHMSFFSYEVNSADGEPNSTHGWSTSAAVDAALASGNTKVTLCVTLFSGHTTFFGSSTAQQTLITNLINLVQTRGAHGVNIDFEGLPSSQTTNFANFMVDLCNQMHTAIPNSEVSTVLYAVDWNNVFDFTIMEPVVDHYIIMGYGYYYTGSSSAGPTDPLYHFGSNYNYTLSRSITYYLDKGCPKDKLILGLPNYGYEWPTNDLAVQSNTTGNGTSRTYAYVRNNTSGNYSAGNHSWEGDSYTDIYAFTDGTPRQCLISLDSSWRKRLEHVRNTGIGGIGIWALGYDNGYTELWDAMNDYLTDCHEDPCSGTIHDFGGPTRSYYNDEDYTWTITPPNATSIDVDFTDFDVELNWDYLYVYDGPDNQAPQIAGSPFTGTSGPGQFTTSTGAVTFRFTSDGLTVTPGFVANYSCNSQLPPVAGFDASDVSICVGDSIQLINTSTDGESFSWATSSGGLSDTLIENPYLYPVSSGIYTITLDVSNGAGTDQVIQVFDITVSLPPVAQVILSSNTVVLSSATVFFTNNSLNADNYYWDFGDLSSSQDSNPWHEYIAAGIYNGYLVASNDGCENDTVHFQVSVGTQGIDDLSGIGVEVFPNPFNSEITIEASDEITDVKLIDVFGRFIPIKTELSISGGEIEAQGISTGTYLLMFTIQGERRIVRMIKE
ncbi:MAG: glycosyl hydrolase family 18 protein [Crocinitomicaceae bacterium]|nr:glycosyl hydrolase family 18 protein [Crocinitomicaceae bacterium]